MVQRWQTVANADIKVLARANTKKIVCWHSALPHRDNSANNGQSGETCENYN